MHTYNMHMHQSVNIAHLHTGRKGGSRIQGRETGREDSKGGGGGGGVGGTLGADASGRSSSGIVKILECQH